MGLLKSIAEKISSNKSEFKAKFKEAQENQKIEETLLNRSKSSNERELIRYQKQMREDDIKQELDKIHHQQNKDNWSSNSLLKSQKSMLKNDRPILKEKNIFKNNKNLFMSRGKL